MYKIRELSKLANERLNKITKEKEVAEDVFRRIDKAEYEILETALNQIPIDFTKEPTMEDNAYTFTFKFYNVYASPDYWVDSTYFYYVLKDDEIEIISKYDDIQFIQGKQEYDLVRLQSKRVSITPEEREILCRLQLKKAYNGKYLTLDGIKRSDFYNEPRGVCCTGISSSQLRRRLDCLLKPFLENKHYIDKTYEISEKEIKLIYYFDGSKEGTENLIQKESEDIYWKIKGYNYSPDNLTAIKQFNFAKMVDDFFCAYAQDYIDGKPNVPSDLVEKSYINLFFKFRTCSDHILLEYNDHQVVCSFPNISISFKLEDISYANTSFDFAVIQPSPSLYIDVSETFRKNPTLYYINNVKKPILSRTKNVFEKDIYYIISDQLRNKYKIIRQYSYFFQKEGDPEENTCIITIENPFYKGRL